MLTRSGRIVGGVKRDDVPVEGTSDEADAEGPPAKRFHYEAPVEDASDEEDTSSGWGTPSSPDAPVEGASQGASSDEEFMPVGDVGDERTVEELLSARSLRLCPRVCNTRERLRVVLDKYVFEGGGGTVRYVMQPCMVLWPLDLVCARVDGFSCGGATSTTFTVLCTQERYRTLKVLCSGRMDREVRRWVARRMSPALDVGWDAECECFVPAHGSVLRAACLYCVCDGSVPLADEWRLMLRRCIPPMTVLVRCVLRWEAQPGETLRQAAQRERVLDELHELVLDVRWAVHACVQSAFADASVQGVLNYVWAICRVLGRAHACPVDAQVFQPVALSLCAEPEALQVGECVPMWRAKPPAEVIDEVLDAVCGPQ